ncbi:MAG TPA: NfeD family protein [Pirellulaceae bacterium]|jgi:membrane-bound serine protease (ClpP class)|nr:NfeD family protein [Pirellulaceae bacterium]
MMLRRLASFLALFCMAVLPAMAQEEAAPPREREAAAGETYWIVLEGAIFDSNANFVRRHLEAAEEAGAETIVLEIDSPGGELQACLSLCEKIQQVDPRTRTIAYVPREALSGAALATIACDERYLAPGARLGDVGVIESGFDGAFRFAEAKLRSDVALRARGFAQESGVAPAFAEAMVDKDLEVFRYANEATGESGFFSEAEIAARPDADDWKRGELVFESRKNNFFEVSGDRADELAIATGLAASDEALAEAIGLARVPPKHRWTWTDTAASFLNHPLVSFLLIAVGLIALYVEFSAPGLSIGGLLAGLCFVLFFWSHFFGGTAQWLEVILFATGIVFLLCEFTVLPGFGIAGVTGLALIVGSTILAMQSFVLPADQADWRALSISAAVTIGACVASTVLLAVLVRFFHVLPGLGKMVLKPESYDPAGGEFDADGKKTAGAGSGAAPLFVGDWGVAVAPLKPTGIAEFADRRFSVSTQGEYLEAGESVRVIALRGKKIVVERAAEEA